MKGLICNHCLREVSAESLAIFNPRWNRFAEAEKLLLIKPMSASEIARALNISYPSAHNICKKIGIQLETVNQEKKLLPSYLQCDGRIIDSKQLRKCNTEQSGEKII